MSSGRPIPSPKRRPTYTFQDGVRVEDKPTASARFSMVSEDFEDEEVHDEAFDNDPPPGPPRRPTKPSDAPGPPRRPTKPSEVKRPEVTATKPVYKLTKPTLRVKPSKISENAATSNTKPEVEGVPPPILGPKPAVDPVSEPGPPLMIRGLAPTEARKKAPLPPPTDSVTTTTTTTTKESPPPPPQRPIKQKSAEDVLPPIINAPKPSSNDSGPPLAPKLDGPHRTGHHQCTTPDTLSSPTPNNDHHLLPVTVAETVPPSVSRNAKPTNASTPYDAPETVNSKSATVNSKSATVNSKSATINSKSATIRSKGGGTLIKGDRASFYESYEADGSPPQDKDGYERPASIQDQYEVTGGSDLANSTADDQDYEAPDQSKQKPPGHGYEEAKNPEMEKEQDDYETVDNDANAENGDAPPPMVKRDAKPQTADGGDGADAKPPSRRQAPAPPPITSIPKDLPPTPTDNAVDGNDGYNEDVYEEINYKTKGDSAPGPAKKGLPPPPTAGDPQEPIEAIYEAIEDVNKSKSEAPPPLPAPFKSKQGDDEPSDATQPTSDGKDEAKSPTPPSSPSPAPSPASPKSKSSDKRSSKRLSGMRINDGRPMWWPRRTKSQANKKLSPMPKNYEETLAELDEEPQALFETTSNAAGVPKFVGDLEFGPYQTLEILEMDSCPPGKWVGRCKENVGFISTANVHVDANALKAMMMNQAPVSKKVSKKYSVEGIALESHGAKLGIRVADKSADPSKVVTRKSKPGDEAPPVPQPFNSSNSVKSNSVRSTSATFGSTQSEMEYMESTIEEEKQALEPQTYEDMEDANAPALADIDKDATVKSVMHYDVTNDDDASCTTTSAGARCKPDYEEMTGPGIFQGSSIKKSPYENEVLDQGSITKSPYENAVLMDPAKEQDKSPYDNTRLLAHGNTPTKPETPDSTTPTKPETPDSTNDSTDANTDSQQQPQPSLPDDEEDDDDYEEADEDYEEMEQGGKQEEEQQQGLESKRSVPTPPHEPSRGPSIKINTNPEYGTPPEQQEDDGNFEGFDDEDELYDTLEHNK